MFSTRRRRKRVVIVAMCLLCLVVIGLLHRADIEEEDEQNPPATPPIRPTLPSFLDGEDQLSDRRVSKGSLGSRVAISDTTKCTMESCFDMSRCLLGFKVFVYPSTPTDKASLLYKRILRVVRSSSYYTQDPAKACLFLPNVDTLDRDPLTSGYVKRTATKVLKLPHWSGGANHLIFNSYSGSWPMYEQELDFPHGKAILAKASFNRESYRVGFDVSFPLLHNTHPERSGKGGLMRGGAELLPVWRPRLLIFKGKRYLYGIGSQTRNALYHLHNDRDILILTTCKHGKDWDKLQDDRCSNDNKLYEKFDYSDLMVNSTFCLVPRGRRLGSFRLLEVLQASCIPVSLSNGYVLPFEEVIDWSKASLALDERQLFQLPHTVRSIRASSVLAMRQQTQFLWETYFNSVEKVVHTTLEIIRNRIFSSFSPLVWNTPPGGLVVRGSRGFDHTSVPFYSPLLVARANNSNYTVVAMATTPAQEWNSPMVRLIRKVCTAAHLSKVVVMWVGEGPPKVMKPRHCKVPVLVVERKGFKSKLRRLFWPLPAVETDAVLYLSEDTQLTAAEAEDGFAVWSAGQDRLVTYSTHRHFWDPTFLHWGFTSMASEHYSIADCRAVFVHRFYGYLFSQLATPTVQKLTDKSLPCLNLAMNFIVSMVTHKAPLKVISHSTIEPLTNEQDQVDDRVQESTSCLNLLVNAFGCLPLYSSYIAAKPLTDKRTE